MKISDEDANYNLGYERGYNKGQEAGMTAQRSVCKHHDSNAWERGYVAGGLAQRDLCQHHDKAVFPEMSEGVRVRVALWAIVDGDVSAQQAPATQRACPEQSA